MGRPNLWLWIIVAKSCLAYSLQQLLSDLKTPSFLVDVQFLQLQLGDKKTPIPKLKLDAEQHLIPCGISSNCPHSIHAADTLDPFVANDSSIVPGLFYLHSRVTQGKATNDDGEATLATLDLPYDTDAHLVLGLNNHHVGSYYWARSAGAGAAMEAPGILLTPESTLIWESDAGYTDCNSNDGKRSEWVNFLKPNDQVQLMPRDPLQALEKLSYHAYGVSSKGRPLGSEPAVVCRWRLEQLS